MCVILQTCKLFVNMAVLGSFYVSVGMHCCCSHVNYKYYDRSLYVGSSDPTYVQNFRPVSLTIFEILGFKLKKKKNNNKNNWRNGLFAISPMLMVQFKIILQC